MAFNFDNIFMNVSNKKNDLLCEYKRLYDEIEHDNKVIYDMCDIQIKSYDRYIKNFYNSNVFCLHLYCLSSILLVYMELFPFKIFFISVIILLTCYNVSCNVYGTKYPYIKSIDYDLIYSIKNRIKDRKDNMMKIN